jgi:hypothetical protein
MEKCIFVKLNHLGVYNFIVHKKALLGIVHLKLGCYIKRMIILLSKKNRLAGLGFQL